MTAMRLSRPGMSRGAFFSQYRISQLKEGRD